MGDQVAAAARLVGAGACMDAVAEAEPKRRRGVWRVGVEVGGGGGGGWILLAAAGDFG